MISSAAAQQEHKTGRGSHEIFGNLPAPGLHRPGKVVRRTDPAHGGAGTTGLTPHRASPEEQAASPQFTFESGCSSKLSFCVSIRLLPMLSSPMYPHTRKPASPRSLARRDGDKNPQAPL